MSKKMMTTTLWALFTLISAGCGAPEAHNPDVEACEHLREGPAAALTAATMNPPPVSNDHKRYAIALVEVTGGKGGSVTFAAAEETDFIFVLNKAVPVAFKDGSGAAVTPESTETSSTRCAEIKAKHTVPLKVGTYTLDLGPTTEIEVGVVIEEAAHEDHK